MGSVESDVVSTLAVVDDTPLIMVLDSEGDDSEIAASVRALIAEVGRTPSNISLAFSNTMR